MTYNLRSHSFVVGGLGLTGQACVRFLKANGAKVKAFDTRSNSASMASDLDVEVTTKSLPENYFEHVDTLVLSPGLALDIEQVKQAIACGVEVIGDVELFARLNTTPVIGITGSNGKTTVTLLTTHMLKTCGLSVTQAGNVGVPVLDTLSMSLDMIVLELSSFQLETTSTLALEAATILNVSDDHLDRHGSMAHYAAIKQRVFAHCNQAIVWRESEWVAPTNSNIKTISYGLDETHSGFGLRNSVITFNGKNILDTRDIGLSGTHNILNVMAALALCYAVGASLERAAQAVKTFKSAPHRCVEIAKLNGVTWIDDSKATNVGATLAAINGFSASTKGRIVLIAGGDGKGADFSVLKQPLKQHVAKVVALGKDAHQFSHIYANTSVVDSMYSAVKCAYEFAQPGDVVLLSPACASIDMFQNYAHRGQVFAEAVASLKCVHDEALSSEASPTGGVCP